MAAELEPGRATVGGRRDAPWLRVAALFIPEALREDAEEYRRARTAVYLCAVPVLTSFGYAWNYGRVLSGGTALLVSGMILAPISRCWHAPGAAPDRPGRARDQPAARVLVRASSR